MNDLPSPRRGVLPLMLFAAASTFAWLWDISWPATLPEAGSRIVPHLLAGVACALWAVWLMFHSPPRPWSRILGVLSLLMVLGVLGVALLGSGSGGSNLNYLTPGNLVLTVLLGTLAIWTLCILIADPPGPAGFSAGLPLLPGALVLVWAGTLVVDYAGWPNLWRGPEFLVVVGGLFGLPLALMARASVFRWSATGTAILYSFLVILASALLYVLPPAWFSSVSGPGHYRVLPVPLLLFLPALAVDWLELRSWPPRNALGDSLRAPLMGAAIIGVTWITHWHAAGVFLAPSGFGREVADLWWPTLASDGDWRLQYWTLLPGRRRWALMMVSALAVSTLSVGTGLWLGDRIRSRRQHLD